MKQGMRSVQRPVEEVVVVLQAALTLLYLVKFIILRWEPVVLLPFLALVIIVLKMEEMEELAGFQDQQQLALAP